LHRIFVFREQTVRPGLCWADSARSPPAGGDGVLFVSSEIPSPRRKVHASPATLPDTAGTVQPKTFLPKLRPEAFYSQNYSFLFSAQDGSFARACNSWSANAGSKAMGRRRCAR